MIYGDLFVGFLRVGMFSFGGAYAAIPLVREVVLSYGWMTEETLSYMIAVSESTPGPIMLNLATYVGQTQAGAVGACLATIAVVLPAFLTILLIMVALKTLLKNQYVQVVLDGLKPCVAGIVLATAAAMIASGCILANNPTEPNLTNIIFSMALAALLFGSKPLFKKKISPIALIVIAACIGSVIY